MQKKIIIGSSSFILPNNSSWNILSKKYITNFAEYANYKEIFGNKNFDKILCFCLFFEDFINSDGIENKSNFILKLIETRLKNSNEPLIFAYANKDNFGVIKLAKNQSTDILKLNKFQSILKKLKKKYKNLYELNLNNEFAKAGTDNVYDDRNWYLLRCRLSMLGIRILAESFYNIIYRIYNAASKVLILDCDNTLWGGVVGEEGLNKILLGQDGIGKAYVDFQISIKKILKQGVILCLCSKNNEKDVWDVFLKNKNMILKKKDITFSKINWNNKADNILAISKHLNLGLNSFVFWDDNAMERNIVKKNLPQVEVVNVPDDVSIWPNMLTNYYSLQKFNITKDDLNKRKQYEQMSNFKIKKFEAYDEIKYLKSIKLKPKLYKINSSNISRAEQLCMKTNQFNLRNKRLTQSDIIRLNKNKNYSIFIVGLSDIFGDHGLVGLLIIKKIHKEIYFIENFLISCRVFGRNLESWMLSKIIEIVKKNNCQYIVTEYIKTTRNQISLNFLKKNDFSSKNSKNINFNLIKKNFDTKNFFVFDIKNNIVPNLEIFKN